MKTWIITFAIVSLTLIVSGELQAQSQLPPSDTPTRVLNEMQPPPVMIQQELLTLLQPEVERGDITIYDAKDMVKINLAAPALFDSGSDRVHPEGADILKRIGSVLKTATNWKATLTGHADNQKIKPPLQRRFASNKELSEARAENGAKILKEVGVDPSIISTVGQGASQPVASNATEKGRSKNRRIELLVVARY
jgi:chemotaxis protein MotB